MNEYNASQIHLIKRPEGLPDQSNFEKVAVELTPPSAGEVLVKNHYMSVDPYMRGRMRSEGVYAEPYSLNEPMYGCLLYTSPSPRDAHESRMPSSA